MRFLVTTFWHVLLLAGIWRGDPMIVNVTVFAIWMISLLLILGSAGIITGKRHIKFEHGIKLDPVISAWSHLLCFAIVASLAAHGWFFSAGILLLARYFVGMANRVGRDAVDAKLKHPWGTEEEAMK